VSGDAAASEVYTHASPLVERYKLPFIGVPTNAVASATIVADFPELPKNIY
jgi:hypothetical protein